MESLTTNTHKQENALILILVIYPGISLINTRKKTQSYRNLLAQDIDPKEERNNKLTEEKAITEHTVKNIALEWYELKKHSVTANYAKDIWRSLERHIFPKLDPPPISKITPQWLSND